MQYDNLSLREEIFRCLNAYNKPVHPDNIRRWIRQDRSNIAPQNLQVKPIESLRKIKDEIRKIDSIEIIKIRGRYYRQFKKEGKLTRGIKWILALKMKLGFIKEAVAKKLNA